MGTKAEPRQKDGGRGGAWEGRVGATYLVFVRSETVEHPIAHRRPVLDLCQKLGLKQGTQ